MWARLSIFLAFTECANSMQTEKSRLHTFTGCLEKGLIDQAHLTVKLKTILQLVRDDIKCWHARKDDNETSNSEKSEDEIKYVTQVSEESSTLTKDVYFDVVEN